MTPELLPHAPNIFVIGGDYMRRIRRQHSRKVRRQCAKLSKKQIKYLVLVIIAVVVYLSHLGIKPVVTTVSGNQARLMCTSIINTAVLDEMAKIPVEYESIVSIVYDSADNVKILETNTIELNKLRARLTQAVNDALAALKNRDVRIPLGTLTGMEMLSGRGPGIKLRMQPSGYVESIMQNNFDSAGINQTRHMIMIEFAVEMSAIIAPYVTQVTVRSGVVVAETIIVGTVPNIFADMGSGQ